MQRREFLKISAHAGSAALLLQSKLIIAAAVAPSAVFASGRIVAVQDDTIYAANENGPVVLRLASTSDIWKGAHGLDRSVLTPGDSIFASGQVGVDGSITVKDLYANIVNYYGRIIRVDGTEFELLPYQPTPLSWTLNAEIEKTGRGTIINNGLGSVDDLRTDRFVQMVGLQQSDGRVVATRIWIYENGRPVDMLN